MLDEECSQGWRRGADQSDVKLDHGPCVDWSGRIGGILKVLLDHNETNNAGNPGDGTETEGNYGKISLAGI